MQTRSVPATVSVCSSVLWTDPPGTHPSAPCPHWNPLPEPSRFRYSARWSRLPQNFQLIQKVQTAARLPLPSTLSLLLLCLLSFLLLPGTKDELGATFRTRRHFETHVCVCLLLSQILQSRPESVEVLWSPVKMGVMVVVVEASACHFLQKVRNHK